MFPEIAMATLTNSRHVCNIQTDTGELGEAGLVVGRIFEAVVTCHVDTGSVVGTSRSKAQSVGRENGYPSLPLISWLL